MTVAQFFFTGDRDIVGSGPGGDPFYVDQEDFPCPAIRFGKNTPEIMALREKEKGDWKSLTLEEKKRRKINYSHDVYIIHRAFSSNFGKRPLAKIGENDRLNIKIGRN